MRVAPLVAAGVIVATACAPVLQSGKSPGPEGHQLAELWQPPTDLRGRDLYFGPGGRQLAPGPNRSFSFVAHKTTGKNPGYDVRDRSGRLWSVKLGEEAQPEVVASRILWAIGYHQPPTYYVDSWNLTGEDAGPQPPGRFRAEIAGYEVVGEWSWYENQFMRTQAFRGLLVAQLVLSNWDLKTSNNKIYQAVEGTRRRYVVRDLGASLAVAKQFPLYKWLGIRDKQGTKNDLDGFEDQSFIERVTDDRIHFAYSGLDTSLFRLISQADVRWACQWLDRLSDRQWDDALRAGGYTGDARTRYRNAIKGRIAQGLRAGSAGSLVRR